MSCWGEGGPTWQVRSAIRRMSSGIWGMPHVLLNQEINVFMRPKNKLEMVQSLYKVNGRGKCSQFYCCLSTAPSMILWQRGLMTVPHQSESMNSKGKVTSLLDLAAARQLLAHCDQVWHSLTKILETSQGTGWEWRENSAARKKVCATIGSGKERQGAGLWARRTKRHPPARQQALASSWKNRENPTIKFRPETQWGFTNRVKKAIMNSWSLEIFLTSF